MQTVKYINSKQESVEFGYAPPLVLQRIEGTGNIDGNTQSQKSPNQDGRTYIDSKLDVRELFLETTILTTDSKTLFELREQIQKVFNPKLGEGILEYSTPNGTKIIKGVSDGTPVFSQYNGNSVKCQITLICNDPFWYDLEANNYEFSAPYIPLFEFPFFTDAENEIEFGLEQETVSVNNEGTVYTPLIIEFHGGVKNATLTNMTTGEFIEIKKELLYGETLIIDTSFGKRKVKLQRVGGEQENGFKYLAFDSKFLQLEEGLNDIEYKAEADGNVTIKIKWTNRYIGL